VGCSVWKSLASAVGRVAMVVVGLLECEVCAVCMERGTLHCAITLHVLTVCSVGLRRSQPAPHVALRATHMTLCLLYM